MMRLSLVLVIALLISQTIFAQQPCATLNIVGPAGGSFPCDSTVVLSADITFPVVKNTNTYTGGSVPFAPEPWISPNTIIANTDDVWSGVINLPFPFCFFGNVYNQMVVGSNGLVCFDLSVAGGFNQWSSWNGGPPNNWICPINNNTLNNTIMSPFHDTNPGIGGVISWGINGIAPCRRMVVNFTSIPMFSCSALIDTQQIVLYEMTNVIDINIKNKPLCSTWNGGIAHEGIQNSTGTVAFMTPGRNGTVWTANDDAYRFTPDGAVTPINYTFTWKDSATNLVLSTNDSLILPPPVTITAVILEVSVTGGCLPYSFADTFHLDIGKINADFDVSMRLGCDEDTAFFTNLTTPALGTTYYWTFGDPSAPSTLTDPWHIYQNQIPYYVTLIAQNAQCLPDTVTKLLNFAHPLDAVITVTSGPIGFIGDSVCLGDWFKAAGASSLPGVVGSLGLQYSWNWGDGSPLETGPFTNNHIYATEGTYTLTLVITDSIGCTDTATRVLYVDPPAFENFVVSDSIACVGDPINFNDTIAPNSIGHLWDFADGKQLPDSTNPNHTFDHAGTYIISLTSYYPICPPHTTTRTVYIEDYPNISLGSDSSICPGITGTVFLNNQMNPNEVMTWSTGEVTNTLSVVNPGHYWATSVSPNGECRSTDSIWIMRDCYLNIPNAFSPDGDGLNEYFFPRELLSSGVTVFKMDIYNRWGENIFTTDKIDGRGWDGMYNGKPQNMGVYVYVIDVEFKNKIKKSFKGNVTLVR
jgi:gliding motility-associated-like protein